MLPGLQWSLSLLGPYLKSVIYGGAALGRGFEKLSVGERGQGHQIITLQVPSVVSCESTSRVGQRSGRASSSSLFTYIFIQEIRYHMHTLPRRQTKWAQKLKRPSLVKQYEVPFL